MPRTETIKKRSTTIAVECTLSPSATWQHQRCSARRCCRVGSRGSRLELPRLHDSVGPKINTEEIERPVYYKDLSLNVDFNKPRDRETNLRGHPAFFSRMEDVIPNCCGYCPKPVTDDDRAAFEEESKIYISGDLTFVKDDPDRQDIGSFHP